MNYNSLDWSREFGCLKKAGPDSWDRTIPRIAVYFNVVKRFILGIRLDISSFATEFEIQLIMVRLYVSVHYNKKAWGISNERTKESLHSM